MFHFPRFPPSSRRVMGRAPTGLPHSDPPGSQAASASPGHFAAWPRPSSAAIAKASTLRPSSGRLTTSRFLTLSPDQGRYLPVRHQTGSRQRQDEPTTVTLPPSSSPELRLPRSGPVLGKTGLLLLFRYCSIVSMQCAWMHRHDHMWPRLIHGRKTQRVSRGALSRCSQLGIRKERTWKARSPPSITDTSGP